MSVFGTRHDVRTAAALTAVEDRKTIVRGRWLCALAFILSGMVPAHAHVKWFAEYDLNQAPLPIGEVLTGQFVFFFLLSVVLIYAFYWVDRYVYRRRILEDVLRRYTIPEPAAFLIMRAAAFVFFGAVSVYGLSGDAFYLTPELKTRHAWVPWLQAAMALCALHRWTVPLVGLGMAVLYVAAIGQYGLFASDPGLLMGLDARTYMVIAGFVEFNLTFVLLSSASLLSRAIALGLAAVFVLAIYKFGAIDAIGHLLIITILAVLILHGPTKGRNFLVLGSKSLWTEAYFMTGLYVLAFVLVFAAFYGLHFLAYGN